MQVFGKTIKEVTLGEHFQQKADTIYVCGNYIFNSEDMKPREYYKCFKYGYEVKATTIALIRTDWVDGEYRPFDPIELFRQLDRFTAFDMDATLDTCNSAYHTLLHTVTEKYGIANKEVTFINKAFDHNVLKTPKVYMQYMKDFLCGDYDLDEDELYYCYACGLVHHIAKTIKDKGLLDAVTPILSVLAEPLSDAIDYLLGE